MDTFEPRNYTDIRDPIVGRYDNLEPILRLKYTRFLRQITHQMPELVKCTNLSAGNTGEIVVFTVPNHQFASYSGIKNVERECDANGFGVVAADKDGIDIDQFTGVNISVFSPVTQHFTSIDTVYAEASLNQFKMVDGKAVIQPKKESNYFKFDEGQIFNPGQQQKWRLILPDKHVEKVRYLGTWDMWV